MSKNYELIIFDCDGTLVDTENVSIHINSEMITALGLPQYTPQKCYEDFRGVSWTGIRNMLIERHDIDLPENIGDLYVGKMIEHINENGMGSVPGSLELFKLCAVHKKVSVVSSGRRKNVVQSLEVARFSDFIDSSKIFAREDVINPKPAPDGYLLAAEKQSITVDNCLAIEDSPSGVLSAVAAGMDVFGFTGTSQDQKSHKKLLLEAGATAVFSDFIHISKALGY